MSSSSSSSITLTPIIGYHKLKIDRYSMTKAVLPYNDHIKSSTFQAAGYSWHVNYYPNGCGRLVKLTHDYLSLQIVLDGVAAAVAAEAPKVQFTACLLNDAGQAVSFTVRRSPVHALAGGCWFLDFIKRADLERPDLGLLRNDSFTVRFGVVVVDKLRSAAHGGCARAPFVAVPPPDLHRHLGELLRTGDGADVVFVAGGEMFSAHRFVLAARSPVFKAELLGPMMEGTGNCAVHIEDMEAQVFKAVLQFVYTDTLPEMEKGEEAAMSQHLLEAADRFDLQRLKLVCEDKLCKHVDTSSVVTTLVLAEQHNCQGLKEACFEFLKFPTNLNAAMAADGFEYLASSCPTVLKELMSKLALR